MTTKTQVSLYIATHNKTGLKYFGKTVRCLTQVELQKKYHGSGMRWKRHLNKHGDDVTMELYGIYDLDENSDNYVKPIALSLSEEWDIVESNEWANLEPEDGLSGGYTNGDNAIKAAKTMSVKQSNGLTIREESEKKRQLTCLKKYGSPTPMYKNSTAVLKRLETLGENGLKENGKKISKALKDKVYAYNIKTQTFEHIHKKIFDNEWYLVGRTAKYIIRLEINGNFYKTLECLCEQENLEYNNVKTLGPLTKPYKRTKIEIITIQNNFNFWNEKLKQKEALSEGETQKT